MADLPLFYVPQVLQPGQDLLLPEETARHIGQVLRMQAGESLLVTDGHGTIAACILKETGKKRSVASIVDLHAIPRAAPQLHMGIAFTKSASRNEWLLEKATELGVGAITPLITERSIREKFRHDRWNSILVSAMIQSQQAWLPALHQPLPFAACVDAGNGLRLIAHCIAGDGERRSITEALKKGDDAQILIGPEGDFSPAEVTLAINAGIVPVTLGDNRLRTETAALAAITHFYLTNHAS